MRTAKLVTGALVATALLSITFIGFVKAETPAPSAHAALTGKVTSQGEGAIDGLPLPQNFLQRVAIHAIAERHLVVPAPRQAHEQLTVGDLIDELGGAGHFSEL